MVNIAHWALKTNPKFGFTTHFICKEMEWFGVNRDSPRYYSLQWSTTGSRIGTMAGNKASVRQRRSCGGSWDKQAQQRGIPASQKPAGTILLPH